MFFPQLSQQNWKVIIRFGTRADCQQATKILEGQILLLEWLKLENNFA